MYTVLAVAFALWNCWCGVRFAGYWRAGDGASLKYAVACVVCADVFGHMVYILNR